MKKTLIVILTGFLAYTTYGQSENASSLIEEGVALHDQAQYQEAIEKYQEALILDPDNVNAYYEMAFSYLALENFDKTEELCRETIDRFPDSPVLKHVYTSYANSLDQRGKSEEALKIYDEGIKKFPDYNMLHFNKGVTTFGLNRLEETRESFRKSAQLNPNHSSSFYYLGLLEEQMGNRISCILSLSRFLILEPKGQRANQILPFLTEYVNTLYVNEVQGSTISTMSTAHTRIDKEKDDFEDIEKGLGYIATFSALLENEEEQKAELEEFETHMQTIFELLEANKKRKKGFNWEFLSPFFIDLYKNGFVETFVYDINSFENGSETIPVWFDNNAEQFNKYVDWLNGYKFED